MDRLSIFIDDASEFFSHRKGLLPLIAMGLVLLNFIVQLIPGAGWLAHTNLFLHLGVIVAIFGFMLARAL